MGAGIHNILEAAVYGIPVGFGPNHQRFFEAGELIKQNWAFTARTPTQLMASLDRLLANPGAEQIREGLHGWFNENRGASQRITEHAVALLGH
jgi:3-deoxy-D-manno-octulosonic-acid transferase